MTDPLRDFTKKLAGQVNPTPNGMASQDTNVGHNYGGGQPGGLGVQEPSYGGGGTQDPAPGGMGGGGGEAGAGETQEQGNGSYLPSETVDLGGGGVVGYADQSQGPTYGGPIFEETGAQGGQPAYDDIGLVEGSGNMFGQYEYPYQDTTGPIEVGNGDGFGFGVPGVGGGQPPGSSGQDDMYVDNDFTDDAPPVDNEDFGNEQRTDDEGEEIPDYQGEGVDDYLDSVFGEEGSFDPTKELLQEQLDENLRRMYEGMAGRGMSQSGAMYGMAGDIMRGHSRDLAQAYEDFRQQEIDNKRDAAQMLFQDSWKKMDHDQQKAMAELMFELDRKRKYGEDYNPDIGDAEMQFLRDLFTSDNLTDEGKAMMNKMLTELFGEDWMKDVYDDAAGSEFPEGDGEGGGEGGWPEDFDNTLGKAAMIMAGVNPNDPDEVWDYYKNNNGDDWSPEQEDSYRAAFARWWASKHGGGEEGGPRYETDEDGNLWIVDEDGNRKKIW